jgi:hypothetical protein
MDNEEPKQGREAAKVAVEQLAAQQAEPNASKTVSGRHMDEQPGAPSKAPITPAQTIATIRASVQSDPLFDGIARTMREFKISERMARDFGLIRSQLDNFTSGRNELSGIARAAAEAQKAIEAAGGHSAFYDQIAEARARLAVHGGAENALRQQRDVERMISSLGGIDAILGRHSAMRDAVTALGGVESIMKRHNDMSLLASGSLAAAGYAKGGSFGASQAIERALRDLAGVSSFSGLLSNVGFDRTQLEALVSSTQAWRAGSGNMSLMATLHARLPSLIPERRRATAADFASAELSQLGQQFARDSARFARLQDEMLGLSRPWVDVANPNQSVSAYVDARALATIVENGPPQSRAVVKAVREELGDYRGTGPVPEVIAADPVLRSAFRLEIGFNADLSSLPPAIIATVFGGFGGAVPRRFEPDPDALESAVHQRARRLELKLRRFIEKRMIAVHGPKWSKQRVPGKIVAGWRARRQTDIDNGRTPSRLFDYAGFEDYRTIIEQNDNWAEVFEPIFKVKTSILETLRRLSLIRNPDAHYRIVTIEDFLDLHTEGRRLDAWMDAAN